VRAALAAAAALGGALALPPLVGFDPYWLYLLGTAFLWAAVASAWNLLASAGPVSFGHAVYFGAGAYASALLALGARQSPWLGILLGAGVAALLALPIGLTAHRLGGASLALATFAYAELWRVIALNWTGLTGGGAGLIGIPPLPGLVGAGAAADGGRTAGYYVGLALLVTALAVHAGLRRTRVGLAWAALREAEDRAALLGIAPAPYRLLAFVCSGALTGVAGAVYAHAVRFVEPDLVFGRGLSILPLVMATFGGVGTLLGPAAGALALHLASEAVFQRAWPALHQLPYALALIAAVLVLPRGLAGLVRWGRP
jgi:branched-chain amino acid transport system permease protein